MRQNFIIFKLIFTDILALRTILIIQLNNALIAQTIVGNNVRTNSTFASWTFGQNLEVTCKYSFSKNLKTNHLNLKHEVCQENKIAYINQF